MVSRRSLSGQWKWRIIERAPVVRSSPFTYDEFAEYVRVADFDLAEMSVIITPLHTLVDRREVTSDSGIMAWEYRGTY